MSVFEITDLDGILTQHLNPITEMNQLAITTNYYQTLTSNNKIRTSSQVLPLDNTFVKACETGNPAYKYLMRMQVVVDLAFKYSCINGQLKIAKWLLKMEPSIDIHSWSDYAFRHSCQNGHLATAEWLITIDNNINIHALDEYAFQLSCYNGHLHIVKWLITIDSTINIHAKNDYAFHWSHKNGHWSTYDWLCSLVNTYGN